MKNKIILIAFIVFSSIFINSCCGIRQFGYVVFIKSNTTNQINIDCTADFGKIESNIINDFPSYREINYSIKCDEVIPEIKVYNNNSVLRVMILEVGGVVINNVGYSLHEILQIEKAGNIPPISTDSIMNYYKNTNNPNYMELSATEMTKTLTLHK
jgi:hypothetical protein